MICDEFIDQSIEISDIVGVLDLASQKESSVPCVAVVSELGPLWVDDHEVILPGDLVESRIRLHNLCTSLSTMKRQDDRAKRIIDWSIDDDSSS